MHHFTGMILHSQETYRLHLSGLGYPPLTPVGLDLAGSMPPSQHWQQDPVINQLFTRMVSVRLLLAQQNSHSALEVKVDALSNRLLLMTDTTPVLTQKTQDSC